MMIEYASYIYKYHEGYSQHVNPCLRFIESIKPRSTRALSSLILDEPNWSRLETPDRTGFRNRGLERCAREARRRQAARQDAAREGLENSRPLTMSAHVPQVDVQSRCWDDQNVRPVDVYVDGRRI